MKNYFVYIITNKWHRVLYVGMTNNLERRMMEHREKLVAGFSKKYNLNKLVWFEEGAAVRGAIEREKQLKASSRKKKLDLINEMNPDWQDLSEDWDLDSLV